MQATPQHQRSPRAESGDIRGTLAGQAPPVHGRSDLQRAVDGISRGWEDGRGQAGYSVPGRAAAASQVSKEGDTDYGNSHGHGESWMDSESFRV